MQNNPKIRTLLKQSAARKNDNSFLLTSSTTIDFFTIPKSSVVLNRGEQDRIKGKQQTGVKPTDQSRDMDDVEHYRMFTVKVGSFIQLAVEGER